MHVELPEKVDRVTIDVAWTKQKHILPAARRMVADGGVVVTLIKPHYEAEAQRLRKGVLASEEVGRVVAGVEVDILAAGFDLIGTVTSPITGAKGNIEVLACLRPRV
jgi:23S rRNA (cytidine1920-2'-O)/16S rRNA (cytidine1409-2'-O)-methyltransferase